MPDMSSKQLNPNVIYYFDSIKTKNVNSVISAHYFDFLMILESESHNGGS